MGTAIIEEDDEVAKLVLRMLRERFENEERTGTHVSDLLFPRQAWLGRRYPVALTEEECLFFTAGRAHHEIVESLIADEEMREVKIEWNGIQGTVDSIRGGPVEFKTTRAQKVYDASGVPGHYVLQLGMYCAMFSQGEKEGGGTLLILYLSTKRSAVFGRKRTIPRLVSYAIRFTDLNQIRDLMSYRKALVEGSVAPPMDTCEPWLCRFCRFRNTYCDGRSDGWA